MIAHLDVDVLTNVTKGSILCDRIDSALLAASYLHPADL